MKKTKIANRTTVWIVAWSGVLGLALTGCSTPEPEREYVIPSTLCGMRISPSLLKPTLPAGKELSVKSNKAVGESSCRVLIDKKPALYVITGWHEKGTSVLEVADGQIGVDLTEKISKDERYAYSDEGAVGQIDCPNHSDKYRRENYQLFTQFFPTGTKAEQSEIKTLLFGLTKAVIASDECTPDQI